MALPTIIDPKASEWEKIGWYLPKKGYTIARLGKDGTRYCIVKSKAGSLTLHKIDGILRQFLDSEGFVSANQLFRTAHNRTAWLKPNTCALSIIKDPHSQTPLYCVTVLKRKHKVHEIYRREPLEGYKVILELIEKFRIRNAGPLMAEKILKSLRIDPSTLPIGKVLRLIHRRRPNEPEFHIVAWKRADEKLQMDARPGIEGTDLCLQPLLKPPANHPSLNPNKIIPPHIPFRALPVLKM